jgi:hypothetical protein
MKPSLWPINSEGRNYLAALRVFNEGTGFAIAPVGCAAVSVTDQQVSGVIRTSVVMLQSCLPANPGFSHSADVNSRFSCLLLKVGAEKHEFAIGVRWFD